jgi:3-oxoacyl-[acyl-carrier-protein] synthase II
MMRSVITGSGMVSSIGANRESNFAALCAGITGNKLLQSFDRERFNLTHAYEIADRLPGSPDVKARSTKWLCTAINEALGMAGLQPGQEGRVVFLVGTGLRELRSLELWWANGQPFDVSELHFGHALRQSTNLPSHAVTLSNACAASLFALGLAEDLLALDQADVVIVAGCDSITESMFGVSDRASLLCPTEVQPFEKDRRGVLLGEGAAAVVLESAAHATARGATPLAVLHGVGTSCDAYHETAPDQAGMLRAMRDAHARAGVRGEAIDLLMAHGTGTTLNDEVEARAIRELFGEQITKVIVTALKSMTGHTSGASGLIGVVTAIECLRHGQIPPTLGLSVPISEAEDFDFVIGEARRVAVNMAQVNAFGFGGVNAVAILGRTDG